MTTALTFTHLRFDVIARTPIKLGRHQAGERLRDALAQVMLRAVCPETFRSEKPSPEHAATCPVCWLLAAEADPGEVRRAYSLVPPEPPLDLVEPGQQFSFVLTLFGQGFQFLPYFVLAAPEVGRIGVGPGRGQFDLQAIWAIHPFTGQMEAVLLPGERVVRVPDLQVGWEAAKRAAEALAPRLEGRDLTLDFLSPTRLVENEGLVRTPDFGVFFRRLLHRIDQLSQQYVGDGRRPREEVEYLHGLADQVRLVDVNTSWVDLWGPSSRTGRKTPMGGFTGRAVYRSRQWEALLPWLLFGQGCQVGKLTVKGNGVYEAAVTNTASYWGIAYRSKEGK